MPFPPSLNGFFFCYQAQFQKICCLAIFGGLVAASVFGTKNLELGTEQQVTMVENSYVYEVLF